MIDLPSASIQSTSPMRILQRAVVLAHEAQQAQHLALVKWPVDCRSGNELWLFHDGKHTNNGLFNNPYITGSYNPLYTPNQPGFVFMAQLAAHRKSCFDWVRWGVIWVDIAYDLIGVDVEHIKSQTSLMDTHVLRMHATSQIHPGKLKMLNTIMEVCFKWCSLSKWLVLRF